MQLSTASISKEIGFQSLSQSSRDVKFLCLQRFLRFFAFGASALILVLFMSEVGIDDSRIGLFMTLTLLGDVVLSFLLTLFADRLGRRLILAWGCVLMALSGGVFVFTDNFWILLGASVFGVISPSGNEIGPFRAVEESTMAQLCASDIRADVFTWYNLIGTVGLALGQILSGWLVEIFTDKLKWRVVNSYRMVWVVYVLLGLAKLAATVGLSRECEAPPAPAPEVELEANAAAQGLLSSDEDSSGEEAEHQTTTKAKPSRQRNGANIVENGSATPNQESPSAKGVFVITKIRKLLPPISNESRSIVTKLCMLFAVDSFASGLATTSWLTYFFTYKFSMAAGVLGTLFFVTSVAAAISNLFAASLARRIGLIKTMVFTHFPSAVCLAMIPVPDNEGLAMLFLILRSSTSTMDRAPRQAFLAAAVLDRERTAVMGVVNVVKTLAQSAGPGVTGFLADIDKFWIALVGAGAMKATYDLTMLKMFVSFQGREPG